MSIANDFLKFPIGFFIRPSDVSITSLEPFRDDWESPFHRFLVLRHTILLVHDQRARSSLKQNELGCEGRTHEREDRS